MQAEPPDAARGAARAARGAEPESVCAHLVDASPYVFRAYFALPESLRDPAGNPVQAVYGFAAFLIKYVADEAPTHLAVAFDESLNTSFRNEVYPAYKAQRELPPPALEAQLAACQEVARALGAATCVHARYEADDLIGTLCAELVRRGHGAVVVSSDKDLTQLVGPRVTWANPAKGERMAAGDVLRKFGVRPEQIADYLGLAGDAVDNIPGVAGVGPKSAALLLAEFETLDELYADLERVRALPLRGARGLAERLARHRDEAFLSRELATVARDAPVALDLEALAYAGARRRAVAETFGRLGFAALAGRVARWAD